MAQQVRDLVNWAPLPNELRRQAMAQQMGAGGARKLNPASLQSRTDNPRNGSGVLKWARWWRIGQEHLRTACLGPGMQDVVGERGPASCRSGTIRSRRP